MYVLVLLRSIELHACMSSVTLATEQTALVLLSKLNINAANSILTRGFRFFCELHV